MASLKMKFYRMMIKRTMKQEGMTMSGNADPMVLRSTMNESQMRMPVAKGVTFDELTLGGVECECGTPTPCSDKGVIIYYHGGGYMVGTARTSRGYASTLAAETGLHVYTVTYRLAPEHPFPAAVDDGYAVYKALLERHPKIPIALIGESAGANLSLVTALRAKDDGITLPACVISLSAPADFSGTVDRTRFAKTDFTVTPDIETIMKDLYYRDNDPKHPYISPLYSDLNGFPPLKLVWDIGETLSPDSERLRDKALAAGVEVEARAWDGTFHAFATMGKMAPEGAQVLTETAAFIHKHC